jgi:hypothetical protein
VKQRTCKVVREIINKANCPSRPKQPGNPGYPWYQVIRLLVYAMLKGIFSNKGLVTHLRKHPDVVRTLGLKSIPHRITIGRWKKQWWLLITVIVKLSNLIQLLVPTDRLVMDSAPIPDSKDPDARIGFYSRGPFIGFKIHWSVNQLGMPIRAMFAKGNRHDSVFAKLLLVKAKHVLGDSAYDSTDIRESIISIGEIPVIARNPRNSGKVYPTPRMLKRHRYIIEQTNSLLKTQILNEKWYRIKGFERKATFVLTGVMAIQVMAVDALLNGNGDWKRISEYRY